MFCLSKKRIIIGFLTLIMVSLIMLSVSGLRISPPRVVLIFEPNMVYEGGVCFVPEGNPHIELDVVGDLVEYITLEKTEMIITGESGCVGYTLRLPESLDRPGMHQALIRGAEVPPEAARDFIVARVRMNHQLRVLVPYPGKYLEINSFQATNAEAGETIFFEAHVTSKGEETINFAKGTIMVFDRDKKQIGSVTTNTLSNLKNEDKGILRAQWNSGNYEKGNYEALLVIDYDGLKTNASARFKLGGLDVELINYTREVYLGGIKPFYVIIESIWSEEIPVAYANINVIGNESKSLTSFDTLTKSIPAWGDVLLQGYVDTDALGLGSYNATITLFFSGLNKTYDAQFSVVETPPPEKEQGKGFLARIMSGPVILQITLVVLLLLLLIVIIWLITLIVPKKKKQE